MKIDVCAVHCMHGDCERRKKTEREEDKARRGGGIKSVEGGKCLSLS